LIGSFLLANASNHLLLAMSKSIAGSIMSAQALFCVLRDWTGQTASEDASFCCCMIFYWCFIFCRIKEKLRNGELLIPGDQWPLFLYAGESFDKEDPWKGLFRSSILVSVSLSMPRTGRLFCKACPCTRVTSTSSPRQPQLTTSTRQHGPGTLESME